MPVDAFQWERCDAAGDNCVDIAGATAATYLQVEDDVGGTIRARGYRDGSLVGVSDPVGPVTSTPPDPPDTNAIPFMMFEGGVDDASVTSWPVPGHVTRHASGGPNNRPWARFSADQSTIQDSDPSHIRVHEWGKKDGGLVPMIQPGKESWQGLGIIVPSGFTAADQSVFAGGEIHQSSDYGVTGPAPTNGPTHDGIGHPWYYVSRGANSRGLAGDPFNQTVFGRASGGGWPLVNFAGGPRLVVADLPTYWLSGTKWDYRGAGWIELWYRDDNLSDWVNVVPRHTGIYTCFNNQNFPMASLYADVSPGTRAIDYFNGFFLDDFDAAMAEMDTLAGFA